MSDHCCNPPPIPNSGRTKTILWIVLILNATMFLVEIWKGSTAGSVSLLADAIDFFGDAANYGLSLYVFHKALTLRAKASLFKAFCMGGFALWVLGNSIHSAIHQELPIYETMTWVGALALLVNIICAALLFSSRGGDSNMRSVWLCSRNDALGNIAVLLAAFGVYSTGTVWPDLAAGLLIASLALHSAYRITVQAWNELRSV